MEETSKIKEELEKNTGCSTIFLEKYGENICWGFNVPNGASGVAITNDRIQGQVVLSVQTLESLLAKVKNEA